MTTSTPDNAESAPLMGVEAARGCPKGGGPEVRLPTGDNPMGGGPEVRPPMGDNAEGIR